MISRLFGFKTLNSRILALVVTMLVVSFAGVIWYVGDATYQLTKENQLDAMSQITTQAAAGLEAEIQAALTQAQVVGSQRAIVDALETGKDADDAAQSRIKTYLKSYSGMWSLYAFDRSGKVVAGSTQTGLDERGKDKIGHDVVKAIVNGKETSVSQKVERTDGDRNVYRVAVAIKSAEGKPLGGFQIAMDLGAYSQAHLMPIKIGDTGYLFVFDAEGVIIAHPDKRLLLDPKLANQTFVREMLQRKSGKLNYTFQGVDKLAAFSPIKATGWIVAANTTEHEMLAGAIALRNMIAIIGTVVCLVLVTTIFFFIRKLVVAPVVFIQRFAQEIASGDFGTELRGSFACELGILAANIRAMKEKIKQELSFAKGVLAGFTLPCCVSDTEGKVTFSNRQMVDILERSGNPEQFLGQPIGEFIYGDTHRETISGHALKSGKTERGEYQYRGFRGTERVVDVTSTPFKDMDGKVMGALATWFDLTEIRSQQKLIEAQNERIAEAARMATDISNRLSTAAEELSAQIEESSRGTENQKNRLTETATAVEQMNASILEVARNSGDAATNAESAQRKAQDGADVVKQSIAAIDTMRARVDQMKTSLGELGKQAEGIGNIIGIISDIADQTNLLALNAAIEAARAGDAGRGFAVVADEVRKLAEKTMTATKEVGAAITSIQHGTRASVEVMESAVKDVQASVTLSDKAGGSLGEIVQVAAATADMVRNIAAAAEEQSAASEQIAKSTEEINLVASETAEAMNQSAQAVSELARMASELKETINRMQAS